MSVFARSAAIPATISTADPPGPPGLISSDPIRRPVAGTRITASLAATRRVCGSQPAPRPWRTARWGRCSCRAGTDRSCPSSPAPPVVAGWESARNRVLEWRRQVARQTARPSPLAATTRLKAAPSSRISGATWQTSSHLSHTLKGPQQREKVTPWSRIYSRGAIVAEHVAKHVAERAGVAPSRFSGQHFAPLRGVVPSIRYAVA